MCVFWALYSCWGSLRMKCSSPPAQYCCVAHQSHINKKKSASLARLASTCRHEPALRECFLFQCNLAWHKVFEIKQSVTCEDSHEWVWMSNTFLITQWMKLSVGSPGVFHWSFARRYDHAWLFYCWLQEYFQAAKHNCVNEYNACAVPATQLTFTISFDDKVCWSVVEVAIHTISLTHVSREGSMMRSVSSLRAW